MMRSSHVKTRKEENLERENNLYQGPRAGMHLAYSEKSQKTTAAAGVWWLKGKIIGKAFQGIGRSRPYVAL